MTERQPFTFRNPQPLAGVVIVWLYVHLAGVVGLALSAWLTLRALKGMDLGAPKETPLASDIPNAFAGLVYGVAALVVGVLILKWIYRSSRNAHSAIPSLEISPPWAVGWYFIPIAALWKPFEAMRQTWQASAGAADWRTAPVPTRLRWWWGLWLVSSVLGQASVRLSFRDDTLSSEAMGAWIDIVSLFVDVPLDLIFIGIVRELTAMQVGRLTPREAGSAEATVSPTVE